MTATPDPVQRQLADLEVRIVRLEHRDGPVPPFVSAAGALEAALLRFVPERAETGKLVRAIRGKPNSRVTSRQIERHD
jgi:hypothetical protein